MLKHCKEITLEAEGSISIEMERNNLFPVFLKLESLETLIVGGGHVGLEKLTAILKNSPKAKISVVARTIQEAIKALASEI